MNGFAADSWPYVIAAYAVTWAVFVGYTIRLVTLAKRNGALLRQLEARAPGSRR